MLARRLVEAGVRLVNVVAWTGLAPGEKFMSVETWDMHGNAGIDIFANGWNGLGWALPKCDEAVSALLEDLQARGMLDSTLVVLVGEFGRTPMSEKGNGRDHNPTGFTMWMAGGGVRGGQTIGRTDDLGLRAVEDRLHVHDLHASILHLLGLDHERLSFYHNGIERRLTDVHGHVLKEILA